MKPESSKSRPLLVVSATISTEVWLLQDMNSLPTPGHPQARGSRFGCAETGFRDPETLDVAQICT